MPWHFFLRQILTNRYASAFADCWSEFQMLFVDVLLWFVENLDFSLIFSSFWDTPSSDGCRAFVIAYSSLGSPFIISDYKNAFGALTPSNIVISEALTSSISFKWFLWSIRLESNVVCAGNLNMFFGKVGAVICYSVSACNFFLVEFFCIIYWAVDSFCYLIPF